MLYRYTMDSKDFEHLARGGVLLFPAGQGSVEIALQDIGFSAMDSAIQAASDGDPVLPASLIRRIGKTS